MTNATVINAGNSGFHILTFVADGYGNLIAEDAYGNHLGMVKFPNNYSDESELAEAMRKLTLEAFETMGAHRRAGVSGAQVQADRRADAARLFAQIEAKLAAEQ